MNLKFTNWYTQALGATFGVIACIYSYLNGYMITYSNIDTYFDTLEFTSIISSYLLLPLCIITLLLAVIKSYNFKKYIFKISIENLNMGVIISTVIIGFMGAKIYFTIPALFILFNLTTYKKSNNCNECHDFEEKVELDIKQEIAENEIKSLDNDNTYSLSLEKEMLTVNSNIENLKDFENCTMIFKKSNSNDIEYKDKFNEINVLETKLEMAQKLIDKKTDIDFVLDVTGLTLEEIENAKNNK